MNATLVYSSQKNKGDFVNVYLLLIFLLLNGPLLNAQSTFMVWVSRSVPSISFIALWASSNFSNSIRA